MKMKNTALVKGRSIIMRALLNLLLQSAGSTLGVIISLRIILFILRFTSNEQLFSLKYPISPE